MWISYSRHSEHWSELDIGNVPSISQYGIEYIFKCLHSGCGSHMILSCHPATYNKDCAEQLHNAIGRLNHHEELMKPTISTNWLLSSHKILGDNPHPLSTPCQLTCQVHINVSTHSNHEVMPQSLLFTLMCNVIDIWKDLWKKKYPILLYMKSYCIVSVIKG